MIEQVKFTISPLEKELEKQTNTIKDQLSKCFPQVFLVFVWEMVATILVLNFKWFVKWLLIKCHDFGK